VLEVVLTLASIAVLVLAGLRLLQRRRPTTLTPHGRPTAGRPNREKLSRFPSVERLVEPPEDLSHRSKGYAAF
jgi:hypothetical protein